MVPSCPQESCRFTRRQDSCTHTRSHSHSPWLSAEVLWYGSAAKGKVRGLMWGEVWVQPVFGRSRKGKLRDQRRQGRTSRVTMAERASSPMQNKGYQLGAVGSEVDCGVPVSGWRPWNPGQPACSFQMSWNHPEPLWLEPSKKWEEPAWCFH